jgi:hypothetical protein
VRAQRGRACCRATEGSNPPSVVERNGRQHRAKGKQTTERAIRSRIHSSPFSLPLRMLLTTARMRADGPSRPRGVASHTVRRNPTATATEQHGQTVLARSSICMAGVCLSPFFAAAGLRAVVQCRPRGRRALEQRSEGNGGRVTRSGHGRDAHRIASVLPALCRHAHDRTQAQHTSGDSPA